MQITANQLANTLRTAIESSDAHALLNLYADDAELRIVDKVRVPKAPLELRGKTAIGEFFKDVCGRAMTHHVDNLVVGEDGVAFTESCQYPDGMRVLCASLLRLRDGKIAHQVNVQAWDDT